MDAKKLAVAVAAVFLVGVGCKGGNLSVDARTRNSATGADGGATTADGGTAAADGGTTAGPLDLGQGILVARARLVVEKIALEGDVAPPPASDAGMPRGMRTRLTTGSRGAAGHGGDDDGDDEREEGEVKLGPFLIDLTGAQMRGGLVRVFDGDVPPGKFHEIKIVVGPVPKADAGVSPGLVAMNGASVIIDGTVAEAVADAGTVATPFSFVSSVRATQKHEIEMTVTVDGTTHNVTLTIDPTGWFKAEGGGRLDPTVPANRPAIEANIKASIRAFEDEDEEDGDHGGDHGGHGGGHGGHGGGHGHR